MRSARAKVRVDKTRPVRLPHRAPGHPGRGRRGKALMQRNTYK
jgi:hypothetical protein